MAAMSSPPGNHLQDRLLGSFLSSRKGLSAVAAVLSLVLAWAVYACVVQGRHGLGVAGLNHPVLWGVYITNYVFYMSISHAGLLLSALLRITSIEWRRPVMRVAEAITACALLMGPPFILLHLGRPHLFWRILTEPSVSSPLFWDVLALSLFLGAGLLYVYLSLIPDLAMLRDRGVGPGWLYRRLARAYQGTPDQRERIGKAIGRMAVAIIPIGVIEHTVVSWIFSRTPNPMWHSSSLALSFVAGASLSGAAATLLAVEVFRKSYGLQDFIRDEHCHKLRQVLLAVDLIWMYVFLSQIMTTYFGGLPAEMAVFWAKVTGEYATLYWVMVFLACVLPITLLVSKATGNFTGSVIASISILIGMWLERFLVIISSLSRPRLEFNWGTYSPTWVELSISLGGFAAFLLLLILFTKLFPVISIWEAVEPAENRMTGA